MPATRLPSRAPTLPPLRVALAQRLQRLWPRVEARRVESGGYAAWCVTAGAGEDFVLLASPLVRARTYRPLLRRFARHFRVTVVELPGSGLASRVPRPWTSSAYADWVAGLLPRLGVTRPWLMGHSDSGAVALLLGARYPERVRGLVLADSVGARRKRSVPRVMGARLVDGLMEPLLNVRAWWHLVSNVLWHPRNFLHRVKESCTLDVLEAASRVTVPTLLAWGRLDRAMPPDCAWRLGARMPRARVHVGPGAHDSPVTRPDAFTRAVLAFIRRAPPREEGTSARRPSP